MHESPVESGTTGDCTKHSASSRSQKKVPPSRTSLRKASKALASASATVASAAVKSATIPQEESGSQHQFPNKRPWLEDRTALDKIIKEQTQSGGGDPQNSSRPTAASTVGNSSSSCTQRGLVNCPVCQSVVLESQINEHLDGCLEGNKPNSDVEKSEMEWVPRHLLAKDLVGYSLTYYTSSVLVYVHIVSDCSLHLHPGMSGAMSLQSHVVPMSLSKAEMGALLKPLTLGNVGSHCLRMRQSAVFTHALPGLWLNLSSIDV